MFVCLFGCLILWLFGCLIAVLSSCFSCLVVKLSGGPIAMLSSSLAGLLSGCLLVWLSCCLYWYCKLLGPVAPAWKLETKMLKLFNKFCNCPFQLDFQWVFFICFVLNWKYWWKMFDFYISTTSDPPPPPYQYLSSKVNLNKRGLNWAKLSFNWNRDLLWLTFAALHWWLPTSITYPELNKPVILVTSTYLHTSLLNCMLACLLTFLYTCLQMRPNWSLHYLLTIYCPF